MAGFAFMLLGALLGAATVTFLHRRAAAGAAAARENSAKPVVLPAEVRAPGPAGEQSISAMHARLVNALDRVQGERLDHALGADLERAIAGAAQVTLELIHLRDRLSTQATTAPVPAAGPPRPNARGTETILVVEDEAPIRSIVRRTLERLGYTILEAADPLQALALLEDERNAIDLLLSDVLMPHMTGTELVQRVREHWPLMRVLYMSGHAGDPAVAQGIVQQGLVVVPKPFTQDELANAVRAALDTLPDPRDAGPIPS